MTEAIPMTADQYIEHQLDFQLRELEASFGAQGLGISGPLVSGVDDLVRTLVENLKESDPESVKLTIVLTTDGGFIEPVQRMVETIRHHYDHVSFVIPNYAFSAGTVFAMSGDDIFMDYYSRLGPIDPQVPSIRGRFVPALGYLKQWDRLLCKAQKGELTEAELALMISGFDQAELYKYEQAQELSVTLLKSWLANYKFKDWSETESSKTTVTDELRESRAVEIARILNDTDRWHVHGHGISLEVLQNEVGLRIDRLEDNPDTHRKVRQYDGLLTDYMRKIGHAGALHTVGHYRPYAAMEGLA
jgi:hypothetical protein